MCSWHKSIAVVLFSVVVVFFTATSGYAQQEGDIYVDSLSSHQKRIEGLVFDRLSALLPRGNFVMRVNVSGEKARVAPPTPAGVALDLPGFRRSASEGGEEKFRITQILIKVIVNQELGDSDQQYLRTVIPVLADFVPDRGDRMDLQTIPSAGFGDQAGPDFGAQPEEEFRPMGLSLWEWFMLGAAALFLMMLFLGVVRLLFWTKRKEPPPPPAQPQPSPMERVKAEDHKKMAQQEEAAQQESELSNLKYGVVKRLLSRPEHARALALDWMNNQVNLKTLIMLLGPRMARKTLMPWLGVEQYKTLEDGAMREKEPDFSRKLRALQEANSYLSTEELNNPELIKPNPMGFLDSLSWGQIAYLIKDEPAKVKAIVLGRSRPADTARILETLPKDVQVEVAVQLGHLHDLPLDMVEGIAQDLSEKARHVPDARTLDVEGPRALVDMMGWASSDTSKFLLQAIRAADSELSEAVDKRFFMFDSIPMVPDALLPQAVRTVPSTTVVQALQGADTEIQRKVIMAFPEQARNGLVTTLRAANYDSETIDEARRQLVARFQVLGEQGKIDLKQISDAWQSQAS